MTVDAAVETHLKAGVPASKLVMGMPFYGRGGDGYPNFQDFNKVGHTREYRECWDEVAKVPYLANKAGKLVFGYENPRSLAIKCQYILKQKLLGGMYWDYDGDNEQGDLRRTVYEGLIEAVIEESLLAIKRAGADMIITYFALELAQKWQGDHHD